MELAQLTERAMQIRQRFTDAAIAKNARGWTREEVDKRLNGIMVAIHEACVAAAAEYGQPGSSFPLDPRQ